MAAEGDQPGQGGNKPNRPPRKKSQKRQRSMQIKTPLTPDEYQAVSAKANATGMSRAAFSRTAMLRKPGDRSPRIPSPDETLLREIKGLHGKYGSNMNQIARNGNAGKPVDLPELRSALKEWGEIRDLMNKALAQYAAPSDDTPEPEGPKGK